MTAPAEVEYHDVDEEKNQTTISITIYEGRNRQVRRMFDAINHPVILLRRIKFGDMSLLGLARGKFRHLTPKEVKDLLASAVKTHKIQ